MQYQKRSSAELKESSLVEARTMVLILDYNSQHKIHVCQIMLILIYERRWRVVFPHRILIKSSKDSEKLNITIRIPSNHCSRQDLSMNTKNKWAIHFKKKYNLLSLKVSSPKSLSITKRKKQLCGGNTEQTPSPPRARGSHYLVEEISALCVIKRKHKRHRSCSILNKNTSTPSEIQKTTAKRKPKRSLHNISPGIFNVKVMKGQER